MFFNEVKALGFLYVTCSGSGQNLIPASVRTAGSYSPFRNFKTAGEAILLAY